MSRRIWTTPGFSGKPSGFSGSSFALHYRSSFALHHLPNASFYRTHTSSLQDARRAQERATTAARVEEVPPREEASLASTEGVVSLQVQEEALFTMGWPGLRLVAEVLRPIRGSHVDEGRVTGSNGSGAGEGMVIEHAVRHKFEPNIVLAHTVS